MADRVTQVVGETLVSRSPNIRLTQVVGEALVARSVHMRVSQVVVEVLTPSVAASGAQALVVVMA